MRIYFYFRSNKKVKAGISMKIWKIERDAACVQTWWGAAILDPKSRRAKPLRALRTKTWRFQTEDGAKRNMRARIAAKIEKGYERTPRRRR
jgi:hypothetical protein